MLAKLLSERADS